jgi:lipopolysaccharide export system permease protein
VLIVSRYLLRQFFTASALVFLGLFITVMTVEAILHLELFQADAGEAWRFTLFRTLEGVPLGLPVACLAGAAWSLTRSARFMELTAIRSGGIRLRRVLAPILLAAVALGTGLAFFEDRVLIPIRGVLHDSEDRARAGKAPTASYSNDRWWFAQGTSLFSAEAYDPKSLQLDRVTIFELDDRRRILRQVDAEAAQHVGDQVWALRDAQILEFDPQGAPSLRRESEIELTLGVSGGELRRALPPPETTSVHRLARWIRERAGNPAQLVNLETAFHARIAQPCAVLVLVLFAVGLSVGEGERQDTLGRALLRALLAAVVYWTAWTAALVLAGSGAIPPALPIWGVTALFLIGGAFLYQRIPE